MAEDTCCNSPCSSFSVEELLDFSNCDTGGISVHDSHAVLDRRNNDSVVGTPRSHAGSPSVCQEILASKKAFKLPPEELNPEFIWLSAFIEEDTYTTCSRNVAPFLKDLNSDYLSGCGRPWKEGSQAETASRSLAPFLRDLNSYCLSGNDKNENQTETSNRHVGSFAVECRADVDDDDDDVFEEEAAESFSAVSCLDYDQAEEKDLPTLKRKLKKGGDTFGAKRALEMLPRRRCMHCQAEETPQWRAGPMGPKTLCNACGVRYKSGRLFPEYRPALSPTFSTEIHSNSHKKIMQMRQLKGDCHGLSPNACNLQQFNARNACLLQKSTASK